MTRSRVVMRDVQSQVDGGRFAAKHLAGDALRVSAEIFADGHDLVAAVAILRGESKQKIELTGLDLAFQCAPDHPWVREHPQWFCHRADGSIACAENPPKVYEDIYPFEFEGEDWRALWQALTDVTLYWADQGVLILPVLKLLNQIRREHRQAGEERVVHGERLRLLRVREK